MAAQLAFHVLVSRRRTSWYLSVVFFNTSAGNLGAGGCLFQGWVSSQSRTICLSNEGGLMPVRYSLAGQKRDESGVRISSIRNNLPLASVPNSNLVSAMMMPLVLA